MPVLAGVADDWTTSHYARDMEYGYEILVENLIDPAHVPFSHNGVGGIARKTVRLRPDDDVTCCNHSLLGQNVRRELALSFFVMGVAALSECVGASRCKGPYIWCHFGQGMFGMQMHTSERCPGIHAEIVLYYSNCTLLLY